MSQKYFVGMDVGSTTVKAVVVDAETDQILWSDYQRHETKQPEKVLEFLVSKAIVTEVDKLTQPGPPVPDAPVAAAPAHGEPGHVHGPDCEH